MKNETQESVIVLGAIILLIYFIGAKLAKSSQNAIDIANNGKDANQIPVIPQSLYATKTDNPAQADLYREMVPNGVWFDTPDSTTGSYFAGLNSLSAVGSENPIDMMSKDFYTGDPHDSVWYAED
jgi:hypothetical protein